MIEVVSISLEAHILLRLPVRSFHTNFLQNRYKYFLSRFRLEGYANQPLQLWLKKKALLNIRSRVLQVDIERSTGNLRCSLEEGEVVTSEDGQLLLAY